jgi:hypothetical protein
MEQYETKWRYLTVQARTVSADRQVSPFKRGPSARTVRYRHLVSYCSILQSSVWPSGLHFFIIVNPITSIEPYAMLNEQLKLSVMETASSINPPAEPTGRGTFGPKVPLRLIWNFWWLGHPAGGIPPLRKVTGKDFRNTAIYDGFSRIF